MLLPTIGGYDSPDVTLFTDLVRAGEEKARVTLPSDLRMFLVHCLLRHIDDPEIVHEVLAFNYLDQSSGALRVVQLKRSGDASLILAGLFPERALRLRVSSSYFRMMGQMFYANLAAHLEVGPAAEQGHFFGHVALHFEMLERVLQGSSKRADEWNAFRRFRAMLS